MVLQNVGEASSDPTSTGYMHNSEVVLLDTRHNFSLGERHGGFGVEAYILLSIFVIIDWSQLKPQLI